jgi:hypothetical protein
MTATSSEPWAEVNWAADETRIARMPVTTSPTAVPAMAANVGRDIPCVSRRLSTVIRIPSPMARPTGL